jgi:hypothetical protein
MAQQFRRQPSAVTLVLCKVQDSVYGYLKANEVLFIVVYHTSKFVAGLFSKPSNFSVDFDEPDVHMKQMKTHRRISVPQWRLGCLEQ